MQLTPQQHDDLQKNDKTEAPVPKVAPKTTSPSLPKPNFNRNNIPKFNQNTRPANVAFTRRNSPSQ
jgi:hypothetical protein